MVWLVVTPNHQLWATDAHGRVKVFFVSTAELPFNLVKPLATISTGAHGVLVRKKYIRLSSMRRPAATNGGRADILAFNLFHVVRIVTSPMQPTRSAVALQRHNEFDARMYDAGSYST